MSGMVAMKCTWNAPAAGITTQREPMQILLTDCESDVTNASYFAVSPDQRHALEAAWLALVAPRSGIEQAAAWWRQLFSRYAEPHRHYHNLSHIRDVLPLVEGDPAAAQALLLLDADLSIFGSDSARYAAYVNAVRKEFQFLSHDEFRRTRVAMIERFLLRPQIYFTRAMQERFEAQARKNLNQELALSS